MRRLFCFLIFAAIFSPLAFSQCQQTGIISFPNSGTSTGKGAGDTLTNLTGCSTWILNWSSSIATMTIQIEYSPDTMFWLPEPPITVITGLNPSTLNTGKIVIADVQPYMRANVISALGPGTVTYSLNGTGADVGGGGIGNVAVTGIPSPGQIPIALAPNLAQWQTLSLPYTQVTGLGSAATQSTAAFDHAGDAAAAGAAAQAASDPLGSASTAQTNAVTLSLQKAANFSDVPSVTTAQQNLGLGSAALQNVNAFEPPIPISTALNYYRGDKTFQNLNSAIWSSLSATIPLTFDSSSGIFACPSCGSGSGNVASVFGRIGIITAQSNDYNTNQVTEAGNLYFTSGRAQAALAGLYEVPLTFGVGLNRSGNTITIPSLGIVDSMVSTGISPSKVGNTTAQWNANRINGVVLSSLATGLLKNVTSTGAPTTATSTDVITLFNACTGVELLAADGNCYAPVGGPNQTISHVFTGTQEIAYAHNLNTLNPVISCFNHASPFGGLILGTDYTVNTTTPATLNISYITATSKTVDCSFNNSGAVGPQGPPGLITGTGIVGVNSGTPVALTISGDATISSTTGAASVTGVEGVPFCSGFSPAVNQTLVYTTSSSPNPCWSAAGASLPSGSTGQVIIYNGSNVGTAVTLSGGATVSSAGVVTLGFPSSSTLGGIQSITASATKFISSISTSGVPLQTQPSCTDLSNSGTACLAAAPAGSIVGTTDTQTLTNKTVDGVSPATMAFVDATSSIQTQINAKQGALGFTPLNAASNLSDLVNAATARTNLGLGTAATQATSAFEVPLTFSSGLNRSTNTITIPALGVTNGMLAGSIQFSKLVGTDISILSTQVTGLPVFPVGNVVGTTDTQSLTNKSIDGVTAVTMGFLDATSSVQTQINSKQNSLGFVPLAPANNLSEVVNAATARSNLGLGTASTQASTAFEVPLTFGSGLNRTGNAITIPALGVTDSMVASGISSSKVGNSVAQWNANQINGVSLASLATGLLKNVTATGAPTSATSTDVVSLFAACTGVELLAADGNCYAPVGGPNQSISHVFTGTQELAYTHNLNTLNPVISCFNHTTPFAGLIQGTNYTVNTTTPATVNITYITATSRTVDCAFNNSGAVGAQGPSGSAPSGTGLVAVNSGVASAITTSGDATVNSSTGVVNVSGINGTSLSSLSVGILKNSSGVLSTAVAADFPTLNQSTTGNAATATALAANPTDCAANQYANTIAASGNLTCAQVTYAQISGTPTLPSFPAGTIVGTTDTQVLTNKSIDGVSNVTMQFVDPTSSIQSQFNGKQASLGYTPLNPANNLSDVGNAATARNNLGITLPVGALVGTTDTQTLTNKTLDGVSPATMAFLDATSSIQTQLNARAGFGLNTFTRTQTLAVNTVTSGATPNFDLSQGNIQYITLSNNASPTFTNVTTGGIWTFIICQDSTGGRTWTWPVSVRGGLTISSTASTCNAQTLQSPNGTFEIANSTGVIGK